MPVRIFIIIVSLSCLSFMKGQSGRPEDTEVYTPIPKTVVPGSQWGMPPSDAVILFDGKNLDAWHAEKNENQPAQWPVENGIFTVDKQAGGIVTRQKFTNYQLHIEWMIPENITGEGQLRGNSGIFLANTGDGDEGYEIQILDSYQNFTYVNGQAASVYKQNAPLVNSSRKPGEWQSYDIVWTAPKFSDNGALVTPATVTVFHNGVLVQDHFSLAGKTEYIGLPSYEKHGALPIKLQSHGDPSEPISFRNIWLRPLE